MRTIRSVLAEQTRDLHEELDGSVAHLDLTQEAQAGALLALLGRGIAPVEVGLERAGAARMLGAWPERRRAHLLQPCQGASPVLFQTAAEVWGGLYVLEGSRLGGRLLSRSPLLADHPFFTADTVPFWPTFLMHLADADHTLCDRQGMVCGARKAFGSFLP